MNRCSFRSALSAFAILFSACDGSSSGSGRLDISLEAETTITDGISAGTSAEDVVDGWTVSFDRYLVAVGAIEISSTANGAERSYPTVRLVDLAALASGSAPLVGESSIPAGRWDHVSYSLVVPDATTELDPSVSEADRDAMIDGGCTYLVEGTMTNPAGQSCPPGGSCRSVTSIAFELCVPATVRFSDCRSEGTLASGFAVRDGGDTFVAFTLHGDHLFFDAFPAGEEVVERRAQWLADADVDADSIVDRAELLTIDTPTEIAELFPSSDYSLANAPGGAILTAFDFVVAQLRTQGHFQGEGECAFDVVP